MKVRRASSLVAYWKDGQLALENYLSHRRVLVHPSVMQIISAWSEVASLSEVQRSLADLPDSDELISLLLEHDILVEEDSELDQKERLLETWKWGHDAKYFHYATQDVAYTFDFDEIRAHFEDKARRIPPPSPFKGTGGKSILLPDPRQLPRPFAEVLSKRRTCRQFLRIPIGLSEVSDILYWTWGKQRYFDQSRLDRRMLKTSPSGGARHPVEVYLIAQRVTGISSGFYHYSVQQHGLEVMGPAPSEEEVVEVYSGQDWVRDSACLFVMSALLPRSMWKYDHSRAYRVVQLDAGHLGQTFHLVCTALGLGPFTTAALQDRAIERMLQVDGVTEVVIYAGATGWPC